jgi:transcriptional regulator with XRE-family HTH domain
MIGDILREWRDIRGLSQLDLALDADVSARHLSFLESGRSQPTRDMVLRLAETLGMPLRDRNGLLMAAGFAPHYGASALDSAALGDVLGTLRMMLKAHEPYPAIALDAAFNIVEANAGWQGLAAALGSGGRAANLADLVFLPGRTREAIVNWPEIANYFLHRMREGLRVRGADTPLRTVYDRAMAQPGVREVRDALRRNSGSAVVPVVLTVAGKTTTWITTVTTFGAPQDAFVEELTIEQFYPAQS